MFHSKQFSLKWIKRLVFSVVVSATFCVAVGSNSSIAAEPSSAVSTAQVTSESSLIDVVVQLVTPSVSEFGVNYKKIHGKLPGKSKQLAHAEKIITEQQVVMAFLSEFNAEDLASIRVSVNGITCKLEPKDIENIERHKLVKNVLFAPKDIELNALPSYYNPPSGFDSLSGNVTTFNGISKLVDQGLTGKDIVIAVIGSGIAYDLEAFGGDIKAQDLPNTQNSTGVIEPGSFPNEKFIGGYDFANDDPDPYSQKLSHETASAAIIAGQAVEGHLNPGVAPEAKLLAIQVGNTRVKGRLVPRAIEYALDPNQDGSFDDRADVINMSFGSEFGLPGNSNSVAVQNATELGVVVVTSAGNSGEEGDRYRVSSPGVSENLITVGAESINNDTSVNIRAQVNNPNGLVFGKRLHLQIDSHKGQLLIPHAGIVNSRGILAGVAHGTTYTLSPALVEPALTCASAKPLNNKKIEELRPLYNGKLLIFEDKHCAATNLRSPEERLAFANSLGALGVISVLANNTHYAKIKGIVQGVITTRVKYADSDFPDHFYYGLKRDHGEAIIAALKADPDTTITLDRNNRQLDTSEAHIVSKFSSRGGAYGNGAFKPDLIASGERVFSIGRFFSAGTSVSAPIVSGVAALLLEQRPALSPQELKALLLNGTSPLQTLNFDQAPFAPLSLQGVGRLNADKSAELTSLAMPAGLGFGAIKTLHEHIEVRTLTIKNLSNEQRYFDISHEVGQANPGVELRIPQAVHIPPNSSKEFTVELVVEPHKLTPDPSSNMLIEADGWIVLSDEKDTLRVGYAAAVEPASDVSIVSTNSSLYDSVTDVSGITLKTITLENRGHVGTYVELLKVTVLSKPVNSLVSHPILKITFKGDLVVVDDVFAVQDGGNGDLFVRKNYIGVLSAESHYNRVINDFNSRYSIYNVEIGYWTMAHYLIECLSKQEKRRRFQLLARGVFPTMCFSL